ncbi:MAG: hypothetical protein GC160_13945 [Acidobacteria bacterium]|nr:hypothetical protein [Acidobacteriota bacterium]
MKTRRKAKAWAATLTIWLAALLLAAPTVLAQGQSRLTGTVTDNTGAVIPGATVTISNMATGVEQTAQTNQSGSYVFPNVTPGDYIVVVEYTGFKAFSQPGVTLDTGFTRTVNAQLEVGEITEVVTVEATTPLLESATSSVGQFIEREQVMNMPMVSRRSASLVRLMGNVSFRSEDGGEAVPKFSMAGGRSQNQMWTLDGSVVQNMAIGTQQLALNPPAEALQEFKAEQNNYAAEYGRAGGGYIIMTTRSGTNKMHGAMYEFFRNNAMDARSFFAKTKAPLRYNIFGGSLGGPIKKNKSFFFFNYQGSRRRDGVTYSSDDVPNIPEKNGDFSNIAGLTLADPLGGVFANNIIPQSRIDRIGGQVAQLYPDPNVASPLNKLPANNYVNNASNSLSQDFWTGKWDHNLSNNDRVSVRFMWVQAPEVIPAVFPNAYADPRAGIRENRHKNTTVNWIHNFSPTVINEFRFNWGDRKHINRSAARFSGANGDLGIQGVNPESFAHFAVNGLTALVPGNQERIQDPIRTIEIVENQTWVKGSHQVKYGVNYRYSRNIDDQNNQTGGSFTFGNRATGYQGAAGVGLAELLIGQVSSASINDADILDRRTDYWGFYVQDDWKATSKLTLNLGVRYEFDTPLWDRNNRLSSFDWNAINPVSGLPGTVTFAGLNGMSKYAHQTYKGALGPRIGLAYKLNDTTVIRSGYAINYYGAYSGAVPNAFALGFSTTGSFTSPDGGFTRAFTLADGMPDTTRDELGPGFGSVQFGQSPRISPDYLRQNQRNGQVQQWNFSIQKQLAHNFLVEATYMANMGHRLGGNTFNWNQIPLVDGHGPAKQSQQLRLFPTFNAVNQRSPDWGNSSYHSGNLKIEKRYSNGLNLLMNYTWAKYLDDIEGNSELAGLAGNRYQHYELRYLDRSYSGSDIRHRVALSAVYDVPVGKGRKFELSNGFLETLAGGWGLGVITEFRTGSPYSVIENTNTSNVYSGSQRSNVTDYPTKAANWRDNVKGTTFFDTSLFSAPGVGNFGNAPSSFCCGPGIANIDASVHKWFDFTERLRLQFRADFYNMPNHAQFANPDQSRGKAGFGVVSSVLTGKGGRVSQLALRLEF